MSFLPLPAHLRGAQQLVSKRFGILRGQEVFGLADFHQDVIRLGSQNCELIGKQMVDGHSDLLLGRESYQRWL
jgi:hypothetical protein